MSPAPIRAIAPARGISGASRSLRLRARPLPESLRPLVPIALLVIGLGAYGTVSSARFLTVTNFQIIFNQITVLGILSVGAMFLIVAGQLDLSVGSGVSLLSVIGAKMLIAGSSEPVVLIALLALGAAIGFVNGAIVAITRVQPFILTLGGLGVLYAIALVLSHQQPVPLELQFAALSLNSIGPVPVAAAIFIGLCLLGAFMLRFTTLGRSAYAIGANEEAAFLAGIPTGRTKVILYTLNGALVGLAAVMLISRVGAGDPNGGAGLELLAVTAVVLGGASLFGGIGTMLGAFAGTFLLGLITNVLQIGGVSSPYEQMTRGAVLMVAVTWAAVRELRRSSGGSLRRPLERALRRVWPAGARSSETASPALEERSGRR